MIYLISNCNSFTHEVYQKATVQDCLNYFENHEWIAIDTETKGFDPHSKAIIALQIGDSENQFVIDIRTTDILHFKRLLESKGCILHNAKFDYKFLKKAGILLDRIFDTMIAECVIYAGYEKFGYGLDVVCNRYTGVMLDKSTRGEFYRIETQPFTEYQVQYAARDVQYLHAIKEKQEIALTKYDLNYCANLEMEVIKALGDIEYNGISLDQEKWLENTAESEIDLESVIHQLDEIIISDEKTSIYRCGKQMSLFGEEGRQTKLNYSSPLQVAKILNRLGFKLEGTSDPELEKVAGEHPFIDKLQEYRSLSKIISTYGRGFLDYINPVTKKLHTSFWQIVSTGRVSSGSKHDNTPNLQNIPASNRFRNCFLASTGYDWVSLDYSGQELRLMADASNEVSFITAMNEGKDPHCFAGSLMFKREITKADKELRQKSKTINFGKPYGMGPSKLAKTLKCSMNEAKELFDLYAAAFPSLNKWLEDQGKFAVTNLYSKTLDPCKRRRWYPKIKEARQTQDSEMLSSVISEVTRFGMNHPIQGSGADIVKEALVEARNLVIQYNTLHKKEVARLLVTVHDEIDCEVLEEFSAEFASKLEELMIMCGNKYVTQVNMEVDTTITKVWQK